VLPIAVHGLSALDSPATAAASPALLPVQSRPQV
jgi:hypothetical protein